MGPTSKLTGKSVRLSASARTLFERCGRRWWFEKIAGRPRETSPAMLFGSAVHSVLETYLKGEEVDALTWSTRAGKVARAGIEGTTPDGAPMLPPPGSVVVETHVKGTCGPLPFAGYVDFSPYMADNGAAAAYRPDVDGRFIGDHKTTSDLRWAKTPTELANDAQTHAYAWKLYGPGGAFNDGQGAGFSRSTLIGLTHVYYVTKGRPRALRVDAVVPWVEVERTWIERYLPAAIEMARLAEVEEADQVPANPGDCRSFYRLCPHADVCSASPTGIQRRAASLLGLTT